MNVCVFCGSSAGNSSAYEAAAHEVGKLLAIANHTLIYGGGKVGLMGVVADAALNYGGKAVGIIPDFLHKREVAHLGLTELHIVTSMHERKMRMADLADAFVVMPGGLGTLDELVEILTWKQLGLINKPIAVLNLNAYFDALMQLLHKMVAEGFLKQSSLDAITLADKPELLFDSFAH
jgi:uncharacterized protein (TIGR00730 family)